MTPQQQQHGSKAKHHNVNAALARKRQRAILRRADRKAMAQCRARVDRAVTAVDNGGAPPRVTRELYAAAAKHAAIRTRQRGQPTKRAVPEVPGAGGKPPRSPQQAAQNMADAWQEVGLSTPTGNRAKLWEHRANIAEQRSRAQAARTSWRPFTDAEIDWAINKSKPRKAAGSDRIPYEMWKLAPPSLRQLMSTLFNRIVCDDKFPKAWTTSVGTPLLKPGIAMPEK